MKQKSIILSTIITLVFGLMIVSGQSNIQTLGVYRQDSCVNILQICSSCSYNNISNIVSPNSTLALGQVSMQQSGTFYNYTFCNNSILGRYIVNGYGDLGGTLTVWSYDYYITVSGRQLTISDSVISGLLFLAILIIASIAFFMAFVFNTKKTVFVSLFFLGLGILLVVVDFGYTLNIISNYAENFGYSSDLFSNIFVLLTILVSAGAIAIMLYLIVFALTKFKSIRYGDSVN